MDNATVDNAVKHYDWNVTGMNCQGCVRKVRTDIEALDPNAEVIGTPKDFRLEVNTLLPAENITAILEQHGYVHHGDYQPQEEEEQVPKSCCKSNGQSTPNQMPDEKPSSCSKPKAENNGVEAKKVTSEAVDKLPESTPKKTNERAQTLVQTGNSVQLALSGITCSGCVNTIQKALSGVPGVTQAEVNFATRTAQVSTDQNVDVLIEAVKRAGYGAEEIEDPNKAYEKKANAEAAEYRTKIRNTWLGVGLGVPMMLWGWLGGSMMVTTPREQFAWGAIGFITFVVMYLAGRHYFSNAITALRHGHANMDTLIAIGTGAAWLYSIAIVLMPDVFPAHARHLYFEASVMILGLINFGQALEVKARGRTSDALRRLLDLRPQQARVKRGSDWQTVDVSQIQIGDQILVRAGDRIPVDGTVIDGESQVDEAMLTGEPIPVMKSTGDTVSAGTMNGNGTFTYMAERVGGDTLLAQIIQMVGKAQNSKPPISRLADRISSVFVPVVVLIAVITAIAWYLLGPEPTVANMLVAAVSVLIIACPCALGLATPISTMIGVGKAAEHGALIRNGDAMQAATKITRLALDKTGTITEGKPTVTQVTWFVDEDKTHQSALLDIALSLELATSHPLADAIIAYTEQMGERQPRPLAHIQTVPGLGVMGNEQAHQYGIGNQRLLEKMGVTVPNLDGVSKAASLVFLVEGQQVVAMFQIEDPIKAGAKVAIERLQQLGIQITMLTGDQEAAAKHVAEQVGISHYLSQQTPEDKIRQVEAFQLQGEIVGMIGDGINDAPALAQANVGFAMGAGTDVAMESADITLIRSDLMNVYDVIAISKATLDNIKQNLWGAFAYNTLGIPLAAGLLFPVTGWLLSPVIAGAAMSLSSITVVTNANRLRLFSPKKG